MSGTIDPVTLTIMNNAFVNICREMGITMMRTAFSPIFNEGLDFSCVLFDRHRNMIGQAEFCPAQLAASLFIVRWTVEELGVDSFEEGDVVLHNDPYRGGAHIPEHSVIRPVFHEDELFGFVANVGHLAEIGGKAVGSFAADATEVFQEGLRIQGDRIDPDPHGPPAPLHRPRSDAHPCVGEHPGGEQELLGPPPGVEPHEVGAEEPIQHLVAEPHGDQAEVPGTGERDVVEVRHPGLWGGLPEEPRDQREVVVLDQAGQTPPRRLLGQDGLLVFFGPGQVGVLRRWRGTDVVHGELALVAPPDLSFVVGSQRLLGAPSKLSERLRFFEFLDEQLPEQRRHT